MISENVFLQGVAPYTGEGLHRQVELPGMEHRIPDGVVNQPVYIRVGNPSDELVYVAIRCGRTSQRIIPAGARSSIHVALRIVEDIEGGETIALSVAAPEGQSNEVVVDLGMVEH